MAAIESTEFVALMQSLTIDQRETVLYALDAAWREGYQWCYDDGADDERPYRPTLRKLRSYGA
jgi:hypothetical protein